MEVVRRRATICGDNDIISRENLNEDDDEKHERCGLRGCCLVVMVSFESFLFWAGHIVGFAVVLICICTPIVTWLDLYSGILHLTSSPLLFLALHFHRKLKRFFFLGRGGG